MNLNDCRIDVSLKVMNNNVVELHLYAATLNKNQCQNWIFVSRKSSSSNNKNNNGTKKCLPNMKIVDLTHL